MNHNFNKLIGAAMMSGLGLWTGAMPAQASAITQFGESVKVFNSPTVAIPGGGNVLETYANVAGNFGNAPGITINSNDPNAIVTFSPNPELQSGGLTDAALAVTSQAGAADVSASMATGTTHLSSMTSDGQPESSTITNIGMMDGLTFHVAGGSANVTLTYSLDGNLGFNPVVTGNYPQSIEYFIGSADMDWTAADDNTGGSAQVGTGETSGFTSFTYQRHPFGFQFQGTFTVTDGEALNLFFAQNMTCAGEATCDFENTGQMGLTLPTGTSFTSNSGFLTPDGIFGTEPGSLLLMGLGMAAIVRPPPVNSLGRSDGDRHAFANSRSRPIVTRDTPSRSAASSWCTRGRISAR